MNRVARHGMVSSSLASLSDDDVVNVLESGEHLGVGLGGSTMRVQIAGTPVFVKLLALTDLERSIGTRSTANLFELPTWYHYGVGSAGFGAWREVQTHELATGWVLDGTAPNFPLLHHWRVVPRTVTPFTDKDGENIERSVEFWDGSSAVHRRLQGLAGSSASVALFLEHVPSTLDQWFLAQTMAGEEATLSACALVEDQLMSAIRCMAAHGVTHFDAHFHNVLTDGHRVYVSDFGLAAATHYDVTAEERRFLERTTHHDLAYTAAELVNTLVAACAPVHGPAERNAYLRRCARDGAAPRLPERVGDIVRRYAPVAVVMNDFYWQLHDAKPTTPYPAEAIATALHGADLLGNAT